MKVFELFSDQSCESPISLNFTTTAACSESECTSTRIGSTTYYTETKCTANVYSHADEVYESEAYLLVDYFRDAKCAKYNHSVAFAATGTCQVSPDGQSAIATLNANGSAQLTYYSDSSCNSSVDTVYTITASELTNQSCASGKQFYSSNGKADTESAKDSKKAVGDVKIKGSVLAAIIVGVLLVLVLVAILLILKYRRRRRRRHQSPGSPCSSQSNDPHAYYTQMSPTKHNPHSPNTTLSTFDRRYCAKKLWDDDIVLSARIPRDELTVGRLLNRGGYGEVYIGSYRGEDVAVKMLLPETKTSMSHVNAFLSEVKLMATLDHPRIVSFVGVAWNQLVDVCVVSEYMVGGDLKALLTNFERHGHAVGFDRPKVKIALDVASALVYLHSCQPSVIHRDLKSKNILLDDAMDAKVTDFGISRERVDATMTGGIGTSFWMAPEVMMGERYDDKADMFSFGVVLSELDSHAMPYALSKSANTTTSSSSSANPSKLPNAAVMQMVAAGKLRVYFSEAGPQSIVELGYACVAVDPAERPTASEALMKLREIFEKEV